MNKYLKYGLISFGIILFLLFLIGSWILIEINNDLQKKGVMSITRTGKFVSTQGIKVSQSLKCFNSAYIEYDGGKRTSFCVKEGLDINCSNMSNVFVYMESKHKLVKDNYFSDDVYEGYWEATAFDCLN